MGMTRLNSLHFCFCKASFQSFNTQGPWIRVHLWAFFRCRLFSQSQIIFGEDLILVCSNSDVITLWKMRNTLLFLRLSAPSVTPFFYKERTLNILLAITIQSLSTKPNIIRLILVAPFMNPSVCSIAMVTIISPCHFACFWGCVYWSWGQWIWNLISTDVSELCLWKQKWS